MESSLGQKETSKTPFPVLAEGFPFIFIPLAAGAAFLIVSAVMITGFLLTCLLAVIGTVFVIFALFCVFFFRNPPVQITKGEGVILSPCNGTVMEVEEKETEKVLRVFLSIFSVHLQRSPVAGTVRSVEHRDGKFFAAWNPEAHLLNEQNIITIESAGGVFTVRQIAGFLARRCVSRVETGDTLEAGKMIGLIKFSSQVDLHMPPDVIVIAKPGDKVQAGITIIGKQNEQ